MFEAKIHPPSRSRIADARAAGFSPRPLLLGLSGGFLALAVSVRSFGADTYAALAQLVRAPLAALARGQHELALAAARSAITNILGKLALSGLLLVALVVLASLLAQGAVFVLPRKARRPFIRARLALTAAVLAGLALLVLCAFRLPSALFLQTDELGGFFAQLTSELALVFVLLLLVDAAFARARFFRALWLTRTELREEQRETYGAPELRAARESARRASAREEP